MDLGGEDLLANDGDPQLHLLGNVSLKNYRVVLKRRRVTDSALRNHLRITTESVAGHRMVECRTRQLADYITVVLAIEVQEFFPAIGEQGRRQLHAQLGSQPKLRSFKLSPLNRGRSTGQPAAGERVPQILH